jgi:hypothetical protein
MEGPASSRGIKNDDDDDDDDDDDVIDIKVLTTVQTVTDKEGFTRMIF